MKDNCLTTSIGSDEKRPNDKILAYIKIFGEEPWNEGYLCVKPECDKRYYALSKVTEENIFRCLSCGSPLEKVYDEQDLSNEWEGWSKNPGFIEKLAEKDGNTVGFIVGWNSDLYTLNSSKFHLNEDELKILERNILQQEEAFDFNDFFYFSEIGVEKQYRGSEEHIAGNLYRSLENDAKNSGSGFIVLRTTQKSDLPFKWFRGLGYSVVYNYNDENDRVIMIKNLTK